jgi:hypothetical protein
LLPRPWSETPPPEITFASNLMSPSHVPHLEPSHVVVPREHWKKSPLCEMTFPQFPVSPAVLQAQPGFGWSHSSAGGDVVVVEPPPPPPPPPAFTALVLEHAGIDWLAIATRTAERVPGMSRFVHVWTTDIFAVLFSRSCERQFMRGYLGWGRDRR